MQIKLEHTCNLQIKLLRVLGHLGTSDKQASDNMYSVVAESMRRGNTGHTIGNAIVYEAVRTIASIYPNPSLLQSGGDCNRNTELISEADCWYVLKHVRQSVLIAAPVPRIRLLVAIQERLLLM